MSTDNPNVSTGSRERPGLSTASRSRDVTGGAAASSAPHPSEAISPSGQENVQNSAGRKVLVWLGTTLKDNAPEALDMLQDVGELAENIPYIKVIPALMLKIIEMKEEVNQYREKWRLVIEDIEDIKKLIEQYEQAFAKHGEPADLPTEKVLENLKELGAALTEVESVLHQCRPTKRKRDTIKQIFRRKELRSAVDTCVRRIQRAKERCHDMLGFINTKTNIETNQMVSVVHEFVQSGKLTHASPVKISVSHGLPARPQIMHGRSGIIKEIKDAIVQNPPARIAILGPGGIGKTSIALTVLHHEEVQSRFKDACYFFSCEAITSRDALIISMGKALKLQADSKHVLDESRVLNALKHQKAIVCLDNLETLWEAQRTETEDFLANLADVSAHLLVTLRGTQRPRNVSWSQPLLPPVEPVDLEAALQIFKQISGHDDEYSEALVNAVDCVPLAVTLLAHIAQNNKSDKIWKRWSKEQIKMLHENQNDLKRLSNIEYSIRLSIESPRMRNNEECLQILSLLAMLPDGVDESLETDLDEIAEMQMQTSIDEILQILKDCALVSDDLQNNKIKVLSPIQLYMRQNHSLENLCPEIYNILRSFLAKWIEQQNHTNNTRFLLLHYLNSEQSKDYILYKAIIFIYNRQWFGIYESELIAQCRNFICTAEQNVQLEFNYLLAHCNLFFDKEINHMFIDKAIALCTTVNVSVELRLKVIEVKGQILYQEKNYIEAELWYNEMLQLAKESYNIEAQFTALIHLSMTSQELNKQNERKLRVNDALQLYLNPTNKDTINNKHQSNDQLGNQFKQFQILYKSEMPDMISNEIKQAHYDHGGLQFEKLSHYSNIWEQTWNLREIANLIIDLNELKIKQQCLEQALELDKECNNKFGQARDLCELGRLHMRLNNLNKAQQCLKQAFELCKQYDQKGQAMVLCELGRLHTRLNNLDQAQYCLEHTFELCKEYDEKPSGQARVLYELGRLHTRLNNLDKAQQCLEQALELYKECDIKLGQALDIYELGILHIRLNNIDKAQQCLEQALELHKECDNREGQAWNLYELGKFHMRLNNLNKAQQCLKHALELCKEYDEKSGQAWILHELGMLHMRLNNLDKAQQCLEQALELHTECDEKSGQAWDLCVLGYLNMQLYKKDNTLFHLNKAFELCCAVDDIKAQACVFWIQGKLYIEFDEFDTAKECLDKALNLYTQYNDDSNLGDCFQLLGIWHLKSQNLNEARSYFANALKLHTKVHCTYEQGNDLQAMGELHMQLEEFEEAKHCFNQALECQDSVEDSKSAAQVTNQTQER